MTFFFFSVISKKTGISTTCLNCKKTQKKKRPKKTFVKSRRKIKVGILSSSLFNYLNLTLTWLLKKLLTRLSMAQSKQLKKIAGSFAT